MKIKCPGCATLLQIPDSAAGKVVKCKCGKQLRAPAAAGAAAPAAQSRPAGQARPAAQASPAQARPAQPRPSGAGPARPAAAASPPLAPAAVSGLFDELTDADLSGVKEVKVPGSEVKRAPSANEKKVLAAAAQDYQKEKRETHNSYMAGAKKEIMSSIGIYVVLGLLQVGVGAFLLAGIEEQAEFMAMQEGAESVNTIFSILSTIFIIKICLGVVFFIASATFMALPMTSAIMAIITYVLGEIVSLIINPISLINIRSWIGRVVIFGGLIQAVNNASYFRFVKSGGRDKDTPAEKKPSANKLDSRAILTAVGALVALIGTFAVGGFFVHRAFTVPPTLTAKGDPERGVPEGYELYEVQGVSIFMPRGLAIDPARGEMEYQAVMTPLGTVFMMGVVDIGNEVLSGNALKQKMERVTGGDYQPVKSNERNGYSCEEGVVSKSTRFAPREGMRAPLLNVEVFQDDGRLIVIGVAQDQDRSGNIIVGQSAEPEIEKVFYDSLKIGPKPAGGFF